MKKARVGRPYIQSLSIVACAAWASTAGLYTYFQMVSVSNLYRCVMLAIVGLTVLCLLYKWVHINRIFAMLAFGVMLGLLLASASAIQFQHTQKHLEEYEETNLMVIAQSDSRTYGSMSSFDALALFEDGTIARVRARMPNNEFICYGQRFWCRCSVLGANDKDKAYYWRQGIQGTITIINAEPCSNFSLFDTFVENRSCFINSVCAQLGQNETSALILALMCGYKSQLYESELYSCIKQSGLAHMVAISGTHLSIVCALLMLFMQKLGVGKKKAIAIQIICVIAYLFESGMPISALRAALMCSASLLSFYSKRRAASQNALSLCILLFIVLYPQTALSVSFALSALSTAGIVFFLPLISDIFNGVFRGRCDAIKKTLALSIAASCLSYPLSAYLFSYISPIGIVATPLVSVFVTMVCSLGLFAVVLHPLVPAAFEMLIFIASMCCIPIEAIARVFSQIEGARVLLHLEIYYALALTLLICVVLYVLWDYLSLKSILVTAFSVYLAFALCKMIGEACADPGITMLDVGQGDAFLVSSKSKHFLIDTGNNDQLLLAGLSHNGIDTLEGIFISHADDDHCGSLIALLGLVNVKHIYLAKDLATCSCDNCEALRVTAQGFNAEIVYLEAKEMLMCGNIRFQVLWPYSFTENGGNADSLCLLFEIDVDNDALYDYSCLFTGDAEETTLKKLLQSNDLQDIDILKIGHHGSSRSISEELLDVLQPEYALMSVGEYNRYGHPASAIVELLDKYGVYILRSDLSGELSCVFKKNGIYLEYYG